MAHFWYFEGNMLAEAWRGPALSEPHELILCG